MRKFVKMMVAAAALTVAVAAGSSAQDEPKKGRPTPGQDKGGRGMTGFGGGGGSIYSMLASNKVLQDELKITDDQKKKLEEVSKAQREKMTEALKGVAGGRDATDEQRKEMREKFEKLQAESKKAYTEVLTADQAKRTQQISYQMSGIRAFSDKDVQTALKMTDDQKEKVKTVMEQYTKDAAELRGGRGGFAGGRPSEEDLKKMQDNQKKVAALGKEAEEKIATGLSDDQKKAWKDMLGEKFDTTKLMQGFGTRRQDS